jgi:hypothetical protein
MVLSSFVSSTKSASRLFASFGGPVCASAEEKRIANKRGTVNWRKYFLIKGSLEKVEELNRKGYFNDMQEEPQKETRPALTWTKRVGIAAFLFFLIKGLLWLIVPALIAYFSLN